MLINLFQTIPTLSLLALLMIPLAYLGQTNQIFSRVGISGTGWAPVLIVLILYALLPITVTTLAGMRMVSNDVMHAAQGIGMAPGQIFWKVQFPIALPVILGGIRVALTQAIGNTILGGLIGAGGMGTLIFLGLAQAAPDLILLGVIPVVLMTLVLDNLLKILVQKLSRVEGRVAID
jgi:osmoprotectant transport system permease protein